MEEHLIVTMFQVFLILSTVVLVVGGVSVVRALWRRLLYRTLSASPRPVASKKLRAGREQASSGRRALR
jgi:hypothetical protein